MRLPDFLRGRVTGDQLRQRVGNLDAGEVLHALGVADQHSQVQAEVGDVGEGPPGVESQRCEHRKNGFGKVAVAGGQLARAQILIVENADAGLFERRQQLRSQTFLRVAQQLFHFAPDGYQLRGGAHVVRPHFRNACLQLCAQPRHPDHEELVQVGPEDGEKLGTFEQRVLLVFGLFQDAALETQQAELAVDVQSRVVEIR